MLIISSREFRQNQKRYFDKVDQGEQVIVQRGSDKSYILMPVDKQDTYFNEEMIMRIKESLMQARNGEYIEVTSSKELKDLLGL